LTVPYPRGLWWRTFAAWVARPAVSVLMMRLATIIDRPLMRLSAGRVRLSFVIPVLLLRVPGRRSGVMRDVPLLYTPDGKDYLLVASNAGQGRLPLWYLNLQARQQVEVVVHGKHQTVQAQELAGAARETAWKKAVSVYPGYVRYQARTPYPIPVVRLTSLL
jgi:deazaflavin-dependent oxidoreductase (nitroreductase family)